MRNGQRDSRFHLEMEATPQRRAAPFRDARQLHSSDLLSADDVTGKVPQAGESKGGIHVVLNHIEGEVVEAAKAPDRDDQQEGNRRTGRVAEQQSRCKDAEEKKEHAFQLDEPGIGEVSHPRIMAGKSTIDDTEVSLV